MKTALAVALACALIITGCRQQEGPDVSGIAVPFTTVRFERDFFSMDTMRLAQSLDTLYAKYPQFFRDFTANILGLPPIQDSGTAAMTAIRQFLRDYRPVYDSVNKVFPDMEEEEEAIVDGLKHVRHYFPDYPLPQRLITFIGPMDAYFQGSVGGYGDAITAEGLAVGLQLHLGRGFSMYSSEMGQALYPAYLSSRFTPAYIPVNCVKNIVDDLFPDQSGGRSLIEQMVEKGKRIYLVKKLLPSTPDSLILGYTGRQLEGCFNNEGLIWNYFVKNGLVYNNDPSQIKNYVGDSPNTPEFGDGAPGNIGLFIGWQIVKKYMSENTKGSLTDLMHTDPKLLFENSRYRPR